jgi:prophage tail gpP-like protein
MQLGGTILSGSAAFSGKDTFSDYWVLGQYPGSSDTYSDPRVTNGASAHASDPTVTRYRPLIVSVECNTAALDFLPKRALWEAAHRSGMGRLGTFKTQGWRDANGAIYQPNATLRIEDDFLGIHESLLVSGVKLTLDESGTLTELKCRRLSGFVPAPIADLPPVENSGAAK